jgi:nicotinate-nucleotide pyrophosphorylase (carboxylating)
MWTAQTYQLIDAACAEDLGSAGDITSLLLPGATDDAVGQVVVRQRGIICGLALGPAICAAFAKRLGAPVRFAIAESGPRECQDGDPVEPGACVAQVHGPRTAVLAVERTLLNFLGRLSGVATRTRQFVDAARRVKPAVQILDTRKTIPGWRELDKYAVRAGGGQNHRFGLHDAVLIKDNHLAGVPVERLAATLTEWLRSVRRTDDPQPPHAKDAVPRPAFVEVEVDNLAQLAEVCKVPGVDIVLLDNFTLEQMRAAVEYRDAQGLTPGRSQQRTLQLEASGGVTLESIAQIAGTGVDRISIGALTHSAPCLDIGLDL